MWKNPQISVSLVTFPQEIFYDKLHILRSKNNQKQNPSADILKSFIVPTYSNSAREKENL